MSTKEKNLVVLLEKELGALTFGRFLSGGYGLPATFLKLPWPAF